MFLLAEIQLTIEQAINRSAKCSGGIVGFSRNLSAYYRWYVTRNSRATFVEATLERADMLSDSFNVHKTSRNNVT